MKLIRKSFLLLFSLAILLLSCNSDKESSSDTPEKETTDNIQLSIPVFSSDSAYAYVKQQVDFGPRVPNSESHKQTGAWIVNKLKSYGATVYEQDFSAVTYDGVEVNLKNIVGSFNPAIKKRILLAAHWDTRPFADKDDGDKYQPMDGANDGASGVGVLLEIGRIISASAPTNVGIDILFFDGEDWGEHNEVDNVKPKGELDSWWCLGSQYWSKNKHIPGYSAYYGILLDMVGAKGAQFHKEGLSTRVAPKIVSKIWGKAADLGYGHVFIDKNKGEIIDDHQFVNKYAKIPMIDIVHYDMTYGYFGDFHHSTKDNLDLIDGKMLGIVGTVL
ncbi:MAG: M28 family peptidase, partial [Cyclobacteriaceae bacterium]|nr:M28 family peptidase [Cyclobacteriaceae bacterium]